MKRFAPVVPGRCINYLTVGRISRHISDPGIFINIQHFFPGFPSILGSKNTSLRIRSPKMTQSADINNIRIRRIDLYPGYMPGIFQTHVLPGLAPVL